MTERDQLRARDGQYMHEMETLCRCGHSAGEHTGARVRVNGKPQQPCLADGCVCECMKKSRKKS